jgi:lysophospholipase L1-like esterase
MKFLIMRKTCDKKKVLLSIILTLILILGILVICLFRAERMRTVSYTINNMRTQNFTEKEMLHVLVRNGSVFYHYNMPNVSYGFSIKNSNYIPTKIKINSQGLRDREYAIEKPNNTLRIISLGDSFTFGLGVENEKAYPDIAEEILNNNSKSKYYEVLNMGVCGHSTMEETELLKARGLRFSPDIVTIGYYTNDFENASRIYELRDVLREKYFNMIEKGELNISSLDVENRINEESVNIYREEIKNESFEEKISRVRNPLKEINKLSKAYNFSVVLIIFPVYLENNFKEELEKISEENNWCELGLSETFSKHHLYNETVYGEIDLHPNAYAHQKIGEALYEKLKECGLIA